MISLSAPIPGLLYWDLEMLSRDSLGMFKMLLIYLLNVIMLIFGSNFSMGYDRSVKAMSPERCILGCSVSNLFVFYSPTLSP